MIISRTLGLWMLRLFPPLFFNRIWTQRFSKDFLGADVKVVKSILNRNINGTTFGGTIFSAADPFYALLYWQAFARKGIKVQTWLKSAHIDYIKPADTSLYLSFKLTKADIKEAEEALNTAGKFVKSHRIEILNAQAEICAIVSTEVYIRTLRQGQKVTIGF